MRNVNIRSILSAVSLVLAVILSGAAASAAVPPGGKRVALVIGNANYTNTVALPNTANDASAVAAALKRLGFEVVTGVDLTREMMNNTLKEFARALVGADVGLFFYAGHGMQVAGENYLIPVDAALKQESDLDFEGVKIDMVVARLLASTRIKIVMLDSCRDNPLASSLARSMGPLSRSLAPSSGLSAMNAGASGTLVAFATAPGMVALDGTGKHSPFTAALLDHIETPGLDVDVMMKRVRGQVATATGERQQPWTNSALNGEFYLNPTAAKPTQVAALGSAAPTSLPSPAGASPARGGGLSADTMAQIDLAAWNVAHRGGQGSKSDYENYLSRHPNGLFAPTARAQIERMGRSGNGTAAAQPARVAAVTPPASSGVATMSAATEEMENALAIDRNGWRDIQRKLTDLGFSTRGIDGRPGGGTRTAISQWQSSKAYPATGYLGTDQRSALMAEPVPARLNSASSGGSDGAGRATTTRQYRSKPRTAERRERTRRSSRGNSNDALGAAIGVGLAIGIACKVARRC